MTPTGQPLASAPRSTVVQSRIDGGVGRHRTEAELGFFGLFFLDGIQTLTTAIVPIPRRIQSAVDRQALTRRHVRWHGQPGLTRKLDPDLELIVLARPAVALVARLTCFFLSIFRGTTKKQSPRPSSHNCRVKTDRSLWVGAPAAYIQMIQALGRIEAGILSVHHIMSQPRRRMGRMTVVTGSGCPKGKLFDTPRFTAAQRPRLFHWETCIL